MADKEQEQQKTRPVFEAKAGLVRATVWPNETKNGIRHNVTLSRRYKDGETWKSTGSFGERDLMDVVRAAVEAEAWIRALTPAESPKAAES
jgi:hypothetical protein